MNPSKTILQGAEKRFIQSAPIIDTTGGDQEKTTVEGYAALYNERTDIGGMFTEVIAPGAFDAVLNDDVRALINHDANLVLARTQSGTLKIWADDLGLKYRFEVPDRTYAKDLLDAIRTGDVSGSSFAFDVDKAGQTWEEREDGSYVRTLTKFTGLMDVSPVTYPAYNSTSVSARSQTDFETAKQEIEASRATKTELDEYEARYMFNKNRSKK